MQPFPPTHLSLVRRVRSADGESRQRALEALAAIYRGPIYAYLRLAHHIEPDDADDLTQDFFAEALRRDLFARFDPARARFRTYVRTCVDAHVANSRKAEQRLKRGGGRTAVSLELAELEPRLTSDADPDLVFHREWVRAVFTTALARLRERYAARGREAHLAAFERYDVAGADAPSPPTYAALAAELGVPVTQVTNWLAAARREFRTVVIDTLRDLTGNDEEFRAEARALLGVEVE